jgi:transitional endoplasmic reticulum ATPase/AAA family ATPase
MVYVGLPGRPSREKVFEVALKARACDSNVDLCRLADDDVSGGYSGAEIVGICREAALLALDDEECMDDSTFGKSPSIQMPHLLKAINATKRQITQPKYSE